MRDKIIILFNIQVFYSKQNFPFAGSNRTGVATADTSHGEEQETHRSGGLYRCITVTRDRMFSAITSESVSKAIIIPRKSVDRSDSRR